MASENARSPCGAADYRLAFAIGRHMETHCRLSGSETVTQDELSVRMADMMDMFQV
jgi:hypothetical protein